ncbi:MAG TPA: ATP-binding protein [Anaerolineaceae bacterium]
MARDIIDTILVIQPDRQLAAQFDRAIRMGGYPVLVAYSLEEARECLEKQKPGLIILPETLPESSGIEAAAVISRQHPMLPVFLAVSRETPTLLRQAMRAGVNECVALPLDPERLLAGIHYWLKQAQARRDWSFLEGQRSNASLKQQIDEYETLTRLGRTVTSSLNLDAVLAAVVEAAVSLTGAEEGTLLLLDDATGELYMRASRNMQEDFARTFRLPVHDTLAGSVIRTGQTVVLDEKTPQKIKTAYLVKSLVYVPLHMEGRVGGVLGVDNRRGDQHFTPRHVKLLSALAEFAIIAIENARLFAAITSERNKLETILTQVRDGVIILDQDQRLLLVNEVARQAFGLNDLKLTGKPFTEIFYQPGMLELVDKGRASLLTNTEISVPDGRIFGAEVTVIPAVGLVITMHDITYLKKLDQIKSEFVQTVSHDLRSPLTAILGYTELIERVGAINEVQRDFIRRVRVSVQNITSLINDLLNLGKIESGFDTRKEQVQLGEIIQAAYENLKPLAAERRQRLSLELPESFPPLFGNPVQLRQMIDNLMENAIKYTPAGGEIDVRAEVTQNQVVLQVSDNGIGIPVVDLPYIFDKFYRASNVHMDVSGTGLGLSIVKSIIDSHDGRVWVDSKPGEGSTFTVVLPVAGIEG